MAVTDTGGTVLPAYVECTSPYEVKLVEAVLEGRFIEPLPKKLIGDKAYASDPLDLVLCQQGIEMIAPHKRNRVKNKI